MFGTGRGQSQCKCLPGATFTDVSGATSASLTFATTASQNGYETVAGNSSNPEILLDTSGNATATWDKATNLATGTGTIWAARYQ